jgi:hypothetical protein
MNDDKPKATRSSWKPSASVVWNGVGVFAGFGLGLAIIFAVMAHFGDRTCQPYAVIAVGVGAAAAFGALLRLLAHFGALPASKVIDAAGKSIAFTAALLLVLLGSAQLNEPSNAAGEQACLSAQVETVDQ